MQELSGVREDVNMAREAALLGNYEQAQVHFEGVLAKVSMYIRTVKDPYLRGHWVKTKDELAAELKIVQEVCAELSAFKRSPSLGAVDLVVQHPKR
eukprot:tig00001229_g7857.t1